MMCSKSKFERKIHYTTYFFSSWTNSNGQVRENFISSIFSNKTSIRWVGKSIYAYSNDQKNRPPPI